MKSNIIIALIALTVALQAGIFYKQNYAPANSKSQQQPVKKAPNGSTVNLAGLPSKGSNSARVVLVEFSDYECPFCARHATGVGVDIEKEFVTTGRVRQVFANNPLPIHPNATMLATAAICAGEQNHYWEMHDVLFAKKPKTKEEVLMLSQDLGVDPNILKNCMETKGEVTKRIEQDVQKAKDLQLVSTPSFAIGIVDDQDRLKIEEFVTGAVPLKVFEKSLNDELDKACKGSADCRPA